MNSLLTVLVSSLLMTIAPLLQVHAKLLGRLTSLHVHGVYAPVKSADLNSLFSALPALQVLRIFCKACLTDACRLGY